MSTRSFRGNRLVRFGEFELDVRAGELRREGVKVRLQEQPYRILAMLLEHPNEVVLREEICKRLWPNGTVVEVSHGINAAVLRLREALGDSAENPRFVETLARRGYRFVAPVEVEHRPSAVKTAGGWNTGELSGQTVSHFRVGEKLGSGGMGVVYRAEDLNLGRPVALKFLAATMAGDPLWVSRFQREARTASALNHPNICTVYAVEECQGQPVIVMELLEGKTLEAMIAEGPIAAGTVLALSLQMAAALDAAHRKGIVHRDLKPGNVLVTDASLKVLDFGLAKQSVGGNLTQTGSIVGTPSYMAPEQFLGTAADARSDIYSFGLVLSEMLTGRRAAEGDGPLPEPAEAPGLAAVLRRALQKDPENRWQTARDLKAALELAVAVPRPVEVRRRTGWKLPAIGVAAAVLLALLGIGRLGRERTPNEPIWEKPATPPVVPYASAAPPKSISPRNEVAANPLPATPVKPAPLVPSRFTLDGLGAASGGRMNLSPDGKYLAYAMAGDIRVRAVDGGDARAVSTGTGGAGVPFWSPDGASLAFTRGGKLQTVSVQGGPERTLGSVHTSLAGAWGPDGTILIGAIGDGLLAVPASGGAIRQVTSPDASYGETRHLLPQFLPGGRKFLYTAGSDKPGQGSVYVASLDSAERTSVLQVDSSATFVPSRAGATAGFLVYCRGNNLLAQPFDVATLRVSGSPLVVAGPVDHGGAASASALTLPMVSATSTTLAYQPGRQSFVRTVAMALGPTSPAQASAGLVVIRNWLSELTR